MNSTDADTGSVDPRPPDGDWLGTPYLRFERHGRTARVTVNRPDARNALTGAMYFGIRYAIDRIASDPDLDNLLLTGTDDVFIPGGDMGSPSTDAWTDFNLWELDATPF